MMVPMFPLPGAYLFPNAIMPLHIFEPRYRAMVDDLLDTAGRMVIASVKKGHESELSGNPPVNEIAGLGEISRHEKLPDGRYLIVLHGLGRYAIEEVEAEDHPYRMAVVEPLAEITVPDEEEPALRAELEEAVKTRASNELEIPEGMDVRLLTDLLLMQLQIPSERMTNLFSEPIQAERARGALQEHARLS